MRRILLLITDLQIGGTPTVVRELATRLHEPGRVEVSVACLSPWGPVADELLSAGIRVTALGARSAAHLPVVIAKLRHLIAVSGFDTLFSFLVHANSVAATVSAFFPQIRFIQSVQTTQPSPRWHWRLQRLVHVAADVVVVPSEATARAAYEWAGIPRHKLTVIPNAVDIAAFDALFQLNLHRASFSPVRVGFLGRLDPIKRVPMLVEALGCRLNGESAGVLQSDPLTNAQLHIFGEGPDLARIEAAAAQHQLADRVFLRGRVAYPQDALREMDVLVLPSEAEGFGLVLIEAMAAGVPVVGTAVPGISDVIRDGMNGVLVESTPSAIHRGISTALNPEFRTRILPAARHDVQQRFGWEAALRQYRRLLRIS